VSVGVGVAVGGLVRVGDADGEAVGLCVAVAVGVFVSVAVGRVVGVAVGVFVSVSVGIGRLADAAPDPIAAGIGANAVERGRWALPLAVDGRMEGAEAPLTVPPSSPFSDVP